MLLLEGISSVTPFLTPVVEFQTVQKVAQIWFKTYQIYIIMMLNCSL